MRADLLKNSIFAVTLAAGVYLPVQAQDVVVGEGPAAYSALDQSTLQKELKEGHKGVARHFLLESVARSHRSHAASDQSLNETASPVLPPPPAQPPTRPVMVYQPITNPKINIAVYDDGYGLTANDLINMRTMLASIPAGHMEGIHSIRWTQNRAYPEYAVTNGELTIFNSINPDPYFRRPFSRMSHLGDAIGQHVYQTKVTEAEKRQWRSLDLVKGWSEESASVIFASYYGSFVSDGPNNLVDDFARQSKAVQESDLFVASFFVSPNTPVIREIKVDFESGIVSSSYGRAYRRVIEKNKEVISLGKFDLFIEEGVATGWVERSSGQDQFKYENGQPVIQMELSRINPLRPYKIPQILLDRLPLIK